MSVLLALVPAAPLWAFIFLSDVHSFTWGFPILQVSKGEDYIGIKSFLATYALPLWS